MLINDEDLDDIKSATCICFNLFLQLILSTKIIKSAVKSAVNWYTVSITMMTDLAQSVTAMDLLKMDVPTCKYKLQLLCLQYTLVLK